MPTRKSGSTLQPLTMDVAIPTDVQLSSGSIELVTLRINEGEPPYIARHAAVIPTEDWSLAGVAPNQILTLTWMEPLAEPPLEPGAYVGEVRILTSTGRELVAPSDGYVHLHLQETLGAPEES